MRSWQLRQPAGRRRRLWRRLRDRGGIEQGHGAEVALGQCVELGIAIGGVGWPRAANATELRQEGPMGAAGSGLGKLGARGLRVASMLRMSAASSPGRWGFASGMRWPGLPGTPGVSRVAAVQSSLWGWDCRGLTAGLAATVANGGIAGVEVVVGAAGAVGAVGAVGLLQAAGQSAVRHKISRHRAEAAGTPCADAPATRGTKRLHQGGRLSRGPAARASAVRLSAQRRCWRSA